MAHVPSQDAQEDRLAPAPRRRGAPAGPVREPEGAHLDPGDARAKLVDSAEDVALPGTRRASTRSSTRSTRATRSARAYVEAHGVAGVRRFHAQRYAALYAMEVETLPRHMNNVYLILEPGPRS